MGEFAATLIRQKMLGRIASARVCSRIGFRSLTTQTSAVATPASGAVTAWRPSTQVTRTLSPYEQEIIAPPSKWLKYQGNAFVENAPDWVPGVLFFFGVYYTGNYFFDKWTREHAIHGGDDE